ncbi:MAG: siphovirus Gp157 family protein [Pikeienuella sp.]
MNVQANIGLIEQVSTQLMDILGDDFDAETFWDSLDGETDAMDIIGHLVEQRVEALAHEAASKEAAAVYTARAKRLADRSKALSRALGAILDATGQSKVTHPLATVSRTKPRSRVSVFDETAIPTQLTVTTVKIDAAAIKKQLEDGETVPGAEIVMGDPGVTVRVK